MQIIQRMGRKGILFPILMIPLFLVLSSCLSYEQGSWAGSSRVGIGGASGEIAVPEKTSTIPPHKAWDTQFDLNYAATITVEWRIESGKQVDFYFMNREQDDRASMGNEPTQPGVDFIRCKFGIVDSGSDAETLSPGKYNIIFRNTGDVPVTVWRRAVGER